jgi:hypothetical protein
MVMHDYELMSAKKYTISAGHFDDYVCAVVQYSAHRPMQHVQGYLRNHLMLPSGKYPLS